MTPRQPAPLADVDDKELQRLCAAWRASARHGNREAFSIAFVLEAEQRRRARNSRIQTLAPEFAMPAQTRQWWKFWPVRRGGRPASST